MHEASSPPHPCHCVYHWIENPLSQFDMPQESHVQLHNITATPKQAPSTEPEYLRASSYMYTVGPTNMAITRRNDDAAHLNALLQPRGRGFGLGGGYGAAGQHDLRTLLATPHRQRRLHKPFWSVRRCWWWRSTGDWSRRRGHSCRRRNLRERPLVADRHCSCCSSHGS